MLYLIGGASRAGKSTLTRRLKAPWLELDLLRMGLVEGLPELGLDMEGDDLAAADRLWPIIGAICNHLIVRPEDYVLEGATLRASTAAAYRAAHPEQVRTCFLGYAEADLEEKYAAVCSDVADWLAIQEQSEIYEYLRHGIAFSRRLRGDCERLRLPYVETGRDFDAALDRALALLRE